MGSKKPKKKSKVKLQYQTKYTTDLIPVVAKNLAKDGKTIQEIADFFEVHKATVYRWFEKVPELCDSIMEGNAQVDDNVEKSFLSRCIGYKYTESKETRNFGQIIVLKSDKLLHPDPGSCIKWLSSRRPEKWAEKQNTVDDEECEVIVNANRPGPME